MLHSALARMSPDPSAMVRVTQIVPVLPLTMAQRSAHTSDPTWHLRYCYIPLTAADAPLKITLVDKPFTIGAHLGEYTPTGTLADIVLVCYKLDDPAAQERMHKVRTCAT
jgi:hypothetical protein